MLSRKIITLLIYIILLAVLFAIQPSLFFDKDGNIKCFGINSNEDGAAASATNTILPLILFVPFIAILSYLIILVIEMIYT
jgi:flagellar basal body-associated protein FliL